MSKTTRKVRALAVTLESGETVRAGETLPSGVSADEIKRLDAIDALEPVGGDTAADAEGSPDDFAAHVADSTIPDLLDEVDGDNDAAQRVLDAEQARGDDARKSLVEALEKQLAGSGE